MDDCRSVWEDLGIDGRLLDSMGGSKHRTASIDRTKNNNVAADLWPY
jgi:hypothetical protein